MIVRLIIFLLINFGALALGGLLMGEGPNSDWYISLNLPPWMPPGWMFGIAWTTIMICFSVYMAILWSKVDKVKSIRTTYAIQLILNIMWNPVFFYFHMDVWSLFVIVALAIVVSYMLMKNIKLLKYYSILIGPYILWLMIAISLNAYITLFN